MPAQSDSTADHTPSPGRRLALAWLRFAAHGLAATVGVLLTADGVLKYLEYADGGVNRPDSYLIGAVVVLWIGLTLLLIGVSGAVERGAARALGNDR